MADERPLSEVGLCTPEEAAARRLPPVAVRTVQRWIENGYLPAYPVGTGRYRRFLLRIKDVDAFTPPSAGAPEGNQFAKKKRGRKKT